MDKHAIIENAFLDELEQISKEAGLMSFLGGGMKGWGQVLRGGPSAMSRGAARLVEGKPQGILGHVGQIYRSGTQGAGERALMWGPNQVHMMGARQGGVLGGLGALAKSRYGQMAGVAGLGAAGLYAGSKLLHHQPQQTAPAQPQMQGYGYY